MARLALQMLIIYQSNKGVFDTQTCMTDKQYVVRFLEHVSRRQTALC